MQVLYCIQQKNKWFLSLYCVQGFQSFCTDSIFFFPEIQFVRVHHWQITCVRINAILANSQYLFSLTLSIQGRHGGLFIQLMLTSSPVAMGSGTLGGVPKANLCRFQQALSAWRKYISSRQLKVMRIGIMGDACKQHMTRRHHSKPHAVKRAFREEWISTSGINVPYWMPNWHYIKPLDV